MSEREGVLVGEARALDGSMDYVSCDVSLWIDGERAHREARCPPFELQTEAGESVRVDAEDLELRPELEVEGRFGELLDSPLALAVLDAAPGDHVHVVLRGAVLEEGTRVHVGGMIRSEGGVPTRMTARVIATGPDADALVHAPAAAKAAEAKPGQPAPQPQAEPETPQPMRGPSLVLAWVLGLMGACSLVASVGVDPYGRAAQLAGLALVGAGVFVWRRRRWIPALEPLAASTEGSGLRWHIAPWLGIFMVVLVLGSGLTAFGAASTSTNSTDVFLTNIGPFVLASVPLMFLVVLLVSDRSSMRRALLMLRARPLASDAARGTFGYFVGVVDGEVGVTWRYAKTTSEQRTERRAEDGTIEVVHSTSTSYTWRRGASKPRECAVRVGDDAFEVSLDGALFGAERRMLEYPSKTEYLEGGHRTSSSSSETVVHATLTETMTSGDDVLVVGRMAREGERVRFSATGEESLLIFSAPADARGVLRSHVVAGTVGFASLVACAVAGVVLLSI